MSVDQATAYAAEDADVVLIETMAEDRKRSVASTRSWATAFLRTWS